MICDEMEISIRRVGVDDHINIIKLFQKFDYEKYHQLQVPEVQNNNFSDCKTNLSMAGLRIDERGGIYLNPLLDSNSAYFKCYVAEDVSTTRLVGYILFFNTLDEQGKLPGIPGVMDDPVAVIEDLFVNPNHRRKGIATQLWQNFLKSSLDRGCFSCECLILPDSKEGILFWEKRLGKDKISEALLKGRRKDQEVIVDLSRSEMEGLFQSLHPSNLSP